MILAKKMTPKLIQDHGEEELLKIFFNFFSIPDEWISKSLSENKLIKLYEHKISKYPPFWSKIAQTSE